MRYYLRLEHDKCPDTTVCSVEDVRKQVQLWVNDYCNNNYCIEQLFADTIVIHAPDKGNIYYESLYDLVDFVENMPYTIIKKT